jgi:hypothetical protein
MSRHTRCTGELFFFFRPLNALPLPPKTRFHQAATAIKLAGATAIKLAAAAAALPPPRCRYLRCRRAAAATLPPLTSPSFPSTSLSLLSSLFPSSLPSLLFFIVDCVCPLHRCRRRCLHRHRGGARWQDGGGGNCRGYARWRCAVDALPAAAPALPASCRCRHRRRTSHRGASADDAALPTTGVFIATAAA